MDKLLFLIAVAIIAASCGTEALKVVTTWQERQVGGKWIGRIVLTPGEARGGAIESDQRLTAETVKMVTTWQERQVGGKWIGRIVLTPVETQDS